MSHFWFLIFPSLIICLLAYPGEAPYKSADVKDWLKGYNKTLVPKSFKYIVNYLLFCF
jgi:hypothetical protein